MEPGPGAHAAGALAAVGAAVAWRLRGNEPPRRLPLWPSPPGSCSHEVWDTAPLPRGFGDGTSPFSPDWRDHLFEDRSAREMAVEVADSLYASLSPPDLTLAEASEGVRRCILFRKGLGSEIFALPSREQCGTLAASLWRDAGLPPPPAASPGAAAPRWKVIRLEPIAPSLFDRVGASAAALIGRLSLNLLGFRSRSAWVGGTTHLHYYDAPAWPQLVGDAAESAPPPLVLIHGMCTHGQSMAPLAALFQGTRRVLVPDLVDFDYGYSASGGGGSGARQLASWEDQVEAVATWLEGLGEPRVDLCGHSLGGWVAQRLAQRLPHRVRRLVLLCPGGSSRYRVTHSAVGMLGPASQFVRAARARAPWAPLPLARAAAAATARQFRSPHAVRTAGGSTWESYLGHAGRPAQPALLLWGSEDCIQLPYSDAAMLRRLPAGTGFYLIGADHFMPITDAATLYVAARAFLDGTPAATALGGRSVLRPLAAEAAGPRPRTCAGGRRMWTVHAPAQWPCSPLSAALQATLLPVRRTLVSMDPQRHDAPPSAVDPARPRSRL